MFFSIMTHIERLSRKHCSFSVSELLKITIAWFLLYRLLLSFGASLIVLTRPDDGGYTKKISDSVFGYFVQYEDEGDMRGVSS